MADLSITPANVNPSEDAITREGVAGSTIAAGQVVSVVDNEVVLADASPSQPNFVRGLLVNSGSAGQPVTYVSSGDVTIGSGYTVGTRLFLSATAGGVCPYADLSTGDAIVYIGIIKSATTLSVNIHNVGAVVP